MRDFNILDAVSRDFNNFTFRNGHLWSKNDTETWPAVTHYYTDLDIAYKYVKKWDYAIQAGGNFGIWTKLMAEKFKTVYTFEPDPETFRCLCYNAFERNIIKFNAAIGDIPGCIKMKSYPTNPGANHVEHNEIHGDIPTVRIDDLALPGCDMMMLDLEGFEMKALKGAIDTIKRYHPVIMAEDKGLSNPYGYKQGDIELYLGQYGYKVVERPNRDVLLVHEENL